MAKKAKQKSRIIMLDGKLYKATQVKLSQVRHQKSECNT